MTMTEEFLLKNYRKLSAIKYETVFYLVDYFNRPDETGHGHAELICINHEDEYLTDSPKGYRFRLDELVKDENLKIYIHSELKEV